LKEKLNVVSELVDQLRLALVRPALAVTFVTVAAPAEESDSAFPSIAKASTARALNLRVAGTANDRFGSARGLVDRVVDIYR
jgi:hypothetical protein